jgi:hypothetical protein
LLTKSAAFCDAVYGVNDNGAESARVAALIATRRGSPGGSLLDVSRGKGGHRAHLREWLDVERVDFDPGMVKAVRAKIYGASFVESHEGGGALMVRPS